MKVALILPLREEALHLPDGQPSPVQAYLSSLSPSAARTQATALNNLAELFSDGKITAATRFPWQNLRYENTCSLAAAMLGIGYAHTSVNKHLVALRRVLKEAYRLNLFADPNDYHHAIAVKSLHANSPLRGRSLEQSELQALIRCCLNDSKNPPLSTRDAALIATMYATGLRRQEAVNLNLSDLNPRESSLRVLGKGHKYRQVYLSTDATEALGAWLALRGRKVGPLFCPVGKSGRILLRRLSPQSVYYLLKERRQQAGLAPFSPHDLRRSTITDLLDADVDLLTVSAIAGHASADTTRRYDRRNENVKRRASEKLKQPYLQEREELGLDLGSEEAKDSEDLEDSVD